MKIQIHHRTVYRYSTSVSFGPHQLMMRPKEGHGIRLDSCSVNISPAHRLRWIRDLHENNIGLVEFSESGKELEIDCELLLDICERNPFDFSLSSEAVEYPFHYDHEVFLEILPLSRSIYARDVSGLRDWLEQLWYPGKRAGTLELLQELNLKIYRTFKYVRRETKGVQSPMETLERESGSCRDFATFFIEACRALGLGTRFVSGYMHCADIDGRMSMHGWAEVYLPGAGWIGFDPSWGILASSHYVPVAVSRHSEHSPPVSGTFYGTSRSFLGCDVDLFVRRVD